MQLKELKEIVEICCKRVARLGELSDVDRATRYRKAEEELMRKTTEAGRRWLAQAMYSGFLYPREDGGATEHLILRYLCGDDFSAGKAAAFDALKRGDHNGFFAQCDQIRDAIGKIVKDCGGREEAFFWEREQDGKLN